MTSDEMSMEEERRSLRRKASLRLLAGALLFALLLAAGYLFFVASAPGQTCDNLGYAGRQDVGSEIEGWDSDLLNEVSRRTLFYALCTIFALSIPLRCPVAGGVVVLVAGGAVFGAEFFKQHLPRPELAGALGVVPSYFLKDTYPSGHTTIGTSLALALVAIFGPLLRPWVAVAAGLLSATYATGVLFIGWHRPSDALGGIAWTGFCFAVATAFLARFFGHHARPRPASSAPKLSALLAGTLIACLWLFSNARSGYSGSRLPFLVETSAIIAAAFALPAWLAFSLRDISWISSLHNRHSPKA